MRGVLVVLFLFLSHFSFGQLASFTLQVTPTNETCSGNGILSFTVTDTTPGATIVYSIYRLPDLTTPIAITSSSSFTGLVSGTYSVVATQSLGALSNSQQQEVTIINQVVPLQYNLTAQNVLCGNDGKIFVNITQGVPVNYEIIAGPMIFPLQTSNTFTGLTTGTYVVRVFDACGDGIVRDITVTRPSIPNIQINEVTTDNIACNTIDVGVLIASGTVDLQYIIAYPLQVEFTVHPPSGAPIVINQTYASGGIIDMGLVAQIPFFYNQLYTFDVKITDACGNVYEQNNNEIEIRMSLVVTESMDDTCIKRLLVNPANYVAPFTVNFISAPGGFDPLQYSADHPGPFNEAAEYFNALTPYPEGNYLVEVTDACGRTATYSYTTSQLPLDFSVVEFPSGCFKEMIIQVGTDIPFTVEFLSAPAGFDPLLFNASHPGPFTRVAGYSNATMAYPEGIYVIKLTDACGRTATRTYETLPLAITIRVLLLPGCEVGYGSVLMRSPNDYQSISIIAAPAGFTHTLPYDVSQNLQADPEFFSMNMLPAGYYTFQSVDNCNRTRTDDVMILGYQISSDEVTITEHCSSFDIDLNYTTNSSGNNFWLQKFNPATNNWENPQTGFSDGLPANLSNSILLTNYVNNVNFSYMGRFRILTTFYIFGNGGDGEAAICENVIREFEYLEGPNLANIYSFSCSDNLFDVIVSASGAEPLQYRITTRNGVPFSIDNATSSLFEGIQPGVYNFQIEDACGNILNRVYDINAPVSFVISASNSLCNGGSGSLSVPYFSFLSYEWWKDNDTATILSTSNVLSFTNFNSATDYGTYHVRITNPGNASSCMDLVLDFTLSDDLNSPEAGTGSNTVLCGSQGTINLFDYLSGSYDNFGTWEEITSSGMLINHLWNAASVPVGVYNFRYRVNGLCGLFDDALVQIEINQIPQSPVATGDNLVCEGQVLHLFASDIPGATYEWTGPNGFLSNDQNPVLENATVSYQGTYSVAAVQNGCRSVMDSFDVTVGKLPDFSLSNHCENNQTLLSAALVDTTLNPETLQYEWTAPDGTVLNENPINVTGNAIGAYMLTVTDLQGCAVTKSITVSCTTCGIPRGISPNNDGLNDEFDLSCLEGIINTKIFNRYGVTVFELDNYINEWKGRDFEDRLLPTGTYYYLVKFDSGETKTGWVYLNY